MSTTFKKIDLYQYVFNKYLSMMRFDHTEASLEASIHQIINDMSTISNDEFCPLITSRQQTRIVLPENEMGRGANNTVGGLQMLQNGQVRRVKSIQNTFSSSSFLPQNKDLIFRRGTNQKPYCLIIEHIAQLRSYLIKFKDPYGELFINSVLSAIFDLQVCFGICKTYGFYLCNPGANGFTVSNIIEKSSFTLQDLFNHFHETIITRDTFQRLLIDVILQLFFTLYNLKQWIGFVHYDLHAGNVMISNYSNVVFPRTKLASTRYGGKSVTAHNHLILFKDRDTTYVGSNEFRCIVKIIDYGYSSMFQNFTHPTSPLRSNIMISPISQETRRCPSMRTNLGGGTGEEIINSVISSNGQNIEILMSDFYYILCFILSLFYISPQYHFGGLGNFPVLAEFFHTVFGLTEVDIVYYIVPEIQKYYRRHFYNRNIVNSLYRRFPLVTNFFQRVGSGGIIDLSRGRTFSSEMNQDTSHLFCINKSPTAYTPNKYNPVSQKLKQLHDCRDWQSCQSGMYLSVPPLLTSLKKYVVTLADYEQGFASIRGRTRYLIQKTDGYSIYKFVFLWQELGRAKTTKPQNRWFDGTFGDDKSIYGSCVYVIPKKSNMKIDIVHRTLMDNIKDPTQKNTIFINGNYFIIDGNYKSLNPPRERDLTGYPIGYYYKNRSGKQMGTALQFPPELLKHYGVVWGRGDNVYISSWAEFADMHETLTENITYAAINSPTKKKITCRVAVIKMRDRRGHDTPFGVNVSPVLKSGVEPYDFAFTSGPFLVKEGRPYFDERILNEEIIFKDLPSCNNASRVMNGAKMSYYSQNNPDNLLFRITEAGGAAVYGQKHSNALLNMTLVGLTMDNRLKFFLIEGRGFDYPGMDRIDAAKMLSRKFGMKTVLSLDGGFSSNAVFYSEAERGWRRLIDIPEDRKLGLVIRLF